jgi:maltodextrin utilization protein YvdJ
MPFGDFYERAEREKYRHWKSVISTFALLAVVLISLIGLYVIGKDYLTEYLKEQSRIIRIDAVCKNLPKPNSFNLVSRENPISYNDNSATEIVYHYQGNSKQEVIELFLVWFSSKYWKRSSDNELIFTKGEQTIVLKSDNNFFTHYDIHCYQQDASYGLYDLSY